LIASLSDAVEIIANEGQGYAKHGAVFGVSADSQVITVLIKGICLCQHFFQFREIGFEKSCQVASENNITVKRHPDIVQPDHQVCFEILPKSGVFFVPVFQTCEKLSQRNTEIGAQPFGAAISFQTAPFSAGTEETVWLNTGMAEFAAAVIIADILIAVYQDRTSDAFGKRQKGNALSCFFSAIPFCETAAAGIVPWENGIGDCINQPFQREIANIKSRRK
jgi:hypothetical protein